MDGIGRESMSEELNKAPADSREAFEAYARTEKYKLFDLSPFEFKTVKSRCYLSIDTELSYRAFCAGQAAMASKPSCASNSAKSESQTDLSVTDARQGSKPSDALDSNLPFAILPDELNALTRFHDCACDGEGYDVPKEMMRRLAEIGLLRRVTANYYEHTTFGLSVINGDFSAQPSDSKPTTQPDIAEMVNRFLGWPLPKDFYPDCGISFDGRKDDEWNKNKTWPIGTNLLTADQAKAMFEHCLRKGEQA